MSDDRVDHPAHYGGAENPYEVIKVIDAWGLGFALGNAVKYVARAGKKAIVGSGQQTGVETRSATVLDLKKARWYLDHAIARLERGEQP